MSCLKERCHREDQSKITIIIILFKCIYEDLCGGNYEETSLDLWEIHQVMECLCPCPSPPAPRRAGGVTVRLVPGLKGGHGRVGASEPEPAVLQSQTNLPAPLRPSGGRVCHDPRPVTSKRSHSSFQKLPSLVIGVENLVFRPPHLSCN